MLTNPSLALRNFDVVVYGSTAGGVIAACRAAQQGAQVAMISEREHIGGMATGGITQCDTNPSYSKGLVRGLPDRYYRRLAARMGYSQQKLWNAYQYSVWPRYQLRELLSMLNEFKVMVFTNETIVSAAKTGTTVTSIITRPSPTLTNGTVAGTSSGTGGIYNAKVFIDATYTGDLLAAANITTAIGRESSATYSESYGGVQNTSSSQFSGNIDPYVTPGTPASGYLPGIAEWVTANGGTAGATGAASPYVQAMAYRLFLVNKTVAAQTPYFVTIPAPANYNAQNYELLGRQMALTGSGITTFSQIVTLYTLLGDGRFDMNNSGPVSVDYIHPQSTEYVTATPERRLQIEYNIQQYILGLIQFIKTDSRIPAAARTDTANYGFDSREFLATGGFSPVAYVRVGRRMVGDFVFTQSYVVNDISTGQLSTDPIALAYYNLDSHCCTRQLVGGYVANEGGFNVTPQAGNVGNYIPMRVLFPKVADCTNVMATFCVSASAAAFSSIRIEPISMTMGDAAGAIAAWAAKSKQSVQSIPYSELLDRLNFWGNQYGGVGACISADQTTWTDGTVTFSGTWTAVTFARAPLLAPHRASQAVGATATFAPNLAEAGLYRVYVQYYVGDVRTTAAPITVNHAGGTTAITLNQNATGQSGDWELIGEFTFKAGAPSTNTVVVGTDGTGSNYSIIAAVKWEKVDSNYLH
jgi:hypothetical protein